MNSGAGDDSLVNVLSLLPRMDPDAKRSGRVLARCHHALARRARRDPRHPAPRASKLLMAFAAIYAIELTRLTVMLFRASLAP